MKHNENDTTRFKYNHVYEISWMQEVKVTSICLCTQEHPAVFKDIVITNEKPMDVWDFGTLYSSDEDIKVEEIGHVEDFPEYIL